MKTRWFGPNAFFTQYDEGESHILKERLFYRVFPSSFIGTSREGIGVDRIYPENFKAVVLPGSAYDCYRTNYEEMVPDDIANSLPVGMVDLWEEENTCDDALQPLFEILIEAGIRSVLSIAVDISGKIGPVVGVVPLRCFFHLPEYSVDIVCDEVFIVPEDGRWGIWSVQGNGAILAAEPDFMDEFLKRSCGEDAYRARVNRYALGESDLVGESNERKPRFQLKPFYDVVGWEFPTTID